MIQPPSECLRPQPRQTVGGSKTEEEAKREEEEGDWMRRSERKRRWKRSVLPT